MKCAKLSISSTTSGHTFQNSHVGDEEVETVISNLKTLYQSTLHDTDPTKCFFDTHLFPLRSNLSPLLYRTTLERLMFVPRTLKRKYKPCRSNSTPEIDALRTRQKIRDYQLQVLLQFEYTSIQQIIEKENTPEANSIHSEVTKFITKFKPQERIAQLLEPISYLLDFTDKNGTGLSNFLNLEVTPL